MKKNNRNSCYSDILSGCRCLILLFFSTITFAQTIEIKGVVLDEKSQTLPGVNVYVKDTNKSTTSDLDGKFAVSVPDSKSDLEFSLVGYKTQTISVGKNSSLTIKMQTDTKELNEVVVVGYGTQRKSDVTGAISKVSSKEILEIPSFNALQGLQGKVSGVNIFTNSGSPSGSNRVIIRGVGTINSSSDPLYVVDGVVMQDFQFLNPNDIESIEVLKDASSTAIYGARGANGVILVTTKRGNKSEKITIGYDSYYSFGYLRKEMDVLDSDQLLEVIKTGFANVPKYDKSKPAPEFTTKDPRLFDANGKPLYNTNWQREATRLAFSQNHQLSIQQGTEKSSIGAFLNYTDSEGIMLNSYLKRINGKLTYDVNPKKWLSFNMNLLVNHSQGNEVEEGGGGQVARRTMIEMPSIFPVKFPDGSWSNSTSITDDYGFEAMANPVHILTTQQRMRYRTQIFGNAALVFHIKPGLDLKTQYGVDRHVRKFKNYSPTDLKNISSPNGDGSVQNELKTYWQEETYLTYNKKFNDNNRINLMLGLSWQGENFESDGGSASGFPDNYFGYNNLGAATTPNPPYSGYSGWTMNSYFVRGGYTLKERYLATFTGRYDGSSRFGPNNKYAFFPSLGLGWIASKESFISNIESINLLKFRTSYGLTGNSEIDPYKSLGTVQFGTALLNGERVTTANINRIPNPDLRWEKTAQFDIGFDLKMFKNKLSLEFDYYYKLTTDLLLDKPIPHSTGFVSITENIGSVSNRGLDILLSTTNIETDSFNWTSSLNLNYNRNRIEKLGTNNEDIEPGPWWVSGSQTILRVGESLNSFYGYTRYGVWGTAEAAEAEKVGQIPGTAKRSTTKSILGKGLPDWTGSFINRLKYKNFDFTLNLQFVMGVDLLQQYSHSISDRTGYGNGLTETLTNAWTEQNQNTDIQQIRNGPKSGQSSELDSHWVTNGSYLRVNAISLGYEAPKSLLGNSGINKCRLYATLNNPWVFTAKSFKGYDPEGSSYDSKWGQNMFFFQYPRPTTFTLGLNVNF